MNDDLDFAVELTRLRGQLKLTIHAMAELLYTSQQTYRSWEEGAKPRSGTAERLQRFVESANEQLQAMESHGVHMADLMPLNLAGSALGIPHETLFHAYRDGDFEAVDLGILGIWVWKARLQDIAAVVR